MARNYEDLSRRGIIALNKDFDKDNNDILNNYLEANDEKYEGIRTIESVLAKVDKITNKAENSGELIKEAISNETNKFLDKVINTLTGFDKDIDIDNVEE